MERVFKKIYIYLSYLLIFSMVVLIFATPAYIKSEKKIDFFSSNNISENIKNMEMNLTSLIYVKNEKGEWVEYQRIHGNENRIWVGIDKVPDVLQKAFIAIEDETFYTHKGINWKRTFGAVGNLIFKFDDTEFGGSTITQQLIKNVTMDNGRNAVRKFREIIRAMLIEKNLNKTQILEAYLNTIALGNGICGVQVASNYYFNKDVSQLSLSECASLAAITKNPSRYNPVTGKDENIKRRDTVLAKMLELEYINQAEYDAAVADEIVLDTSQETVYESDINNYFVDTLIEQVIDELCKKYNCTENIASSMLYNGGFKIYSTLNPNIQEAMESVYENVDRYFRQTGLDFQGNKVHAQSAMSIMDYSGHIVGIVGGAGEKTVNRGLNRAWSSPRQPGSTMKPIGVYALAIEKDLIHYSSKVSDQPIEKYYPDGKPGPKEWYGYYKGDITVDYAIRKSANTIPVRLLKSVGIDVSYDFLKNKLGCKYLNEGDKNLSALALGGCTYGITTTESAAAYAIFGNQGKYYSPTTYYKVENMSGETILEYTDNGKQVISPATATIMNHLLQGVVYGSEGTGGGIAGFNYSLKAFAKTGTSSESNDLWMVAGSPYYVGSVWYGFDKQQAVSNQGAASTIWRDVMRSVHKGLPKLNFVDSPDVYLKGSGYYKNGTVPDNLELYIEEVSSEQTTSSDLSSAVSSVESIPSEPGTSTDSSANQNSSQSSDTSSDDSASNTSSGTNSEGTTSQPSLPANPDVTPPSETIEPTGPTKPDEQEPEETD